MSVAASPQRTWRFPRPLLQDHLVFGFGMWALAVVIATGVVTTVSRFGDISISAWEVAAGAATWYIGVIGGYVWYQALPMLIAHGRTRRDAAIELAIFLVVFVAIASVLVTAGYLIEHIVYGIGGWPREIGDNHLFASHTDVPLMLLEYAMTLVVWGAAGALVGAGFYRYDNAGWLTLLPASILIGFTGSFTQSFLGPIGFIMERLFDLGSPSIPVVIIVHLACVAAALAMTWPIVRDVPLHNR